MMTEVSLKMGCSGRFRFETRDADGRVTNRTGWTRNLITNNGMNMLATVGSTQEKTAFVSAGSGSAAPAFTDTQLANRIATTNRARSSSTSVNTTTRYAIETISFEFDQGVAAGNLSEVGIGQLANGTSLFSRALIRDAQGQPTTLTVLPSEFLTVVYEFRVKQPTTDVVATIDGRTVTTRAARVGGSGTGGWSPLRQYVVSASAATAAGSYESARAMSTGIEGIESSPGASTNAGDLRTSITDAPYVGGSFTRQSSIVFDITVANFNIAAIRFCFGPGVFQSGFSPAIPKNNTQRVTFVVRLTWERE